MAKIKRKTNKKTKTYKKKVVEKLPVFIHGGPTQFQIHYTPEQAASWMGKKELNKAEQRMWDARRAVFSLLPVDVYQNSFGVEIHSYRFYTHPNSTFLRNKDKLMSIIDMRAKVYKLQSELISLHLHTEEIFEYMFKFCTLLSMCGDVPEEKARSVLFRELRLIYPDSVLFQVEWLYELNIFPFCRHSSRVTHMNYESEMLTDEK